MAARESAVGRMEAKNNPSHEREVARVPRDEVATAPSLSRVSFRKETQDGGRASSCNMAYCSRNCGDRFTYCHYCC